MCYKVRIARYKLAILKSQHKKKKLSRNPDFISQNGVFKSRNSELFFISIARILRKKNQNCAFRSRNSDFISGNCDFLSHNSESSQLPFYFLFSG